MPTLEQIRSGAFSAVGQAAKTGSPTNNTSARDINTIRTGAMNAVRVQAPQPAARIEPIAPPPAPPKVSFMDKVKGVAKSILNTGKNDPAVGILNPILEDKKFKLQKEQVSPKPRPDVVNMLNADIQNIEGALNDKNPTKKLSLAVRYSNTKNVEQVKGALTSFAKSLLDGIGQIYQMDAVKDQNNAKRQEEIIRQGFEKLNIPDSEKQGLLEKYSPRYNAPTGNPLEKTMAEREKNAKAAIEAGRVPFKKVMETYIEDVTPSNPGYADKIVQGVATMGGFYVAAVATGGGSVIPGVLEALGESGSVYEENIKKGMTPVEAFQGSSKTFIANVVWNTVLNKFSGLFEDLGEPAIKAFKDRVFKTVQAGSFEGIQEAGQTLISNVNTKKEDIWEGVLESLGIGALIGSGAKGVELSVGNQNTNQMPGQAQTPSAVKPESISTIRPTAENVTPTTDTIETKGSGIESVTSIVDDAQPAELNEAVKNVQRYIQTPEVKLTEPTLKALEQAKVGVDELKFKEDGTITLYRDGNVEVGKPNSYSLDKKSDQEAYILNKDEVILNTNSDKLSELYNQAFDEQTAPGMIDALKKFNGLEAEVIAIPKEVRQAPIINQDVQPKRTVEKPAVPTPPQPDTKTPVGTGESKPSRFAQRIQEQMLSDDPARYEFNEATGKYNTLNLEEDARKATEYLESNPEEAVAVSLGIIDPPKGQTANAVGVATALKAKDEGNYSLYAELINSVSLRSTRMGQEIVTLRGQFNNDSAENYVKRAIDGKMKALAGNLVTGAEIGGKKLGYKEKVMKRIDKETAKLKERLAKDQIKIRKAQDIIDALRC